MTPALALGIDLGTTFSTVAFVGPDGKPVVIPARDGSCATPSVLWRDDKGILEGFRAEEKRKDSPARIIECLKRAIGEPLERYAWDFQNTPYDATEWTSVFLASLIAHANSWLCEQGFASRPVNNVVITIPAYFNQTQRLATIRAAELAGLQVQRTVNEPTAAAIAHGLWLEHEKTILVWDLGGGTFDLTLLRCNGNRSFDVLMNDGVTVGGKDWDDALKNHFVNFLGDEHGMVPEEIDRKWLTAPAVEAKVRLSTQRVTTVDVPAGKEQYPVTITRPEFEQLTAKCLLRCEVVVQNLVARAQEKKLIAGWDSIQELVLVGGSSRMPMVQKCARGLFGRDITLGEFDLAIAKGAALLSMSPVAVTDVTPKSLGIVFRDNGRDRVHVMIEKDTAIPCERVEHFKAPEHAIVRVVQGSAGVKDEERSLDEFKDVGRFPIGNPSAGPVEVHYRYNVNGTVSVTYSFKKKTVTNVISIRSDDISDVERSRAGRLRDGLVAGDD